MATTSDFELQPKLFAASDACLNFWFMERCQNEKRLPWRIQPSRILFQCFQHWCIQWGGFGEDDFFNGFRISIKFCYQAFLEFLLKDGWSWRWDWKKQYQKHCKITHLHVFFSAFGFNELLCFITQHTFIHKHICNTCSHEKIEYWRWEHVEAILWTGRNICWFDFSMAFFIFQICCWRNGSWVKYWFKKLTGMTTFHTEVSSVCLSLYKQYFNLLDPYI